jgi:tetratricopeptide (TPR) repeat protein
MTEQEKDTVNAATAPDYLHLLEQEILHHPEKSEHQDGHSSLLKNLYRSVDLSMQQARTHEKPQHLSQTDLHNVEHTGEVHSFSQLHHLIQGIQNNSTQAREMFEEWKMLFPKHYTGWWMSRLVVSLISMTIFMGIPCEISLKICVFLFDLTRNYFALNLFVVLLTIGSLLGSLALGMNLFLRSFTWVEKITPKIGWLNKISLFFRPNRLVIDHLEKKVELMTGQAQALMQPEFQKQALAFFTQFRLDINDKNASNYDQCYQLMKQSFENDHFKIALNQYQSLIDYLENDNEALDNEALQAQMSAFIAQLDASSLSNQNHKVNIHQTSDELKHIL